MVIVTAVVTTMVAAAGIGSPITGITVVDTGGITDGFTQALHLVLQPQLSQPMQ